MNEKNVLMFVIGVGSGMFIIQKIGNSISKNSDRPRPKYEPVKFEHLDTLLSSNIQQNDNHNLGSKEFNYKTFESQPQLNTTSTNTLEEHINGPYSSLLNNKKL